MRIAIITIPILILASCAASSRPPPPAEPADFPLPPLSATVVGALIAAADELALDTAQLQSLDELDGPLRERYDLVERELADLRTSASPRPTRPPGDGPPRGRGGGMGGGGMGGPPPGGGGMGGGGMGGGGTGGGGMGGPPPGGGMGGPPPGGGGGDTPRPPRPPPDDPDARRAARARAAELVEQRDREQLAAAERALTFLRDDQLERAHAIIADYFARAAAPPRVPPSPDGSAPPREPR